MIAGSAPTERLLINPFAVAIMLGSLAGLVWLGQADGWGAQPRSSRNRLASVERIDGGLISLGGGLIGARAGFVLTHWLYYGSHPWESLWFWQGGLSWMGGAIGAAAGLSLYAAARRRPFWILADSLALPVALFSISAWIGCLLDGCAYGRRASFGLLTPTSPDLWGNLAQRWPTQTIGALLGIAVFALLLVYDRRKPRPGAKACLAMILLSGGGLGLEFLRADPAPVLAGLRLEALGAGAFMAVGIIGLAWRGFRGNPEGT